MKILKGCYQGVELTIPQEGHVRPTVDHLKKEIFKITGDLSRKYVWDLFAGSGNVALECLSRGAAHAVLVERTTSGLNCIKLNLAECALKNPQGYQAQKVVLVKQDVQDFLKNPEDHGVNGNPDLVFLDPPYGESWIARIIPLLESCPSISKTTLIVAEHVIDDPLPSALGRLKLVAQKSLGPKLLSLLQEAP